MDSALHRPPTDRSSQPPGAKQLWPKGDQVKAGDLKACQKFFQHEKKQLQKKHREIL